MIISVIQSSGGIALEIALSRDDLFEYEPEPRNARRRSSARELTGKEFHAKRRTLHISQRELAARATARLSQELESQSDLMKITEDDISALETGSKDSCALKVVQLKAIAQALSAPLTAAFRNGRCQTIDLDDTAPIRLLYNQGGRPTLSTFLVHS